MQPNQDKSTTNAIDQPIYSPGLALGNFLYKISSFGILFQSVCKIKQQISSMNHCIHQIWPSVIFLVPENKISALGIPFQAVWNIKQEFVEPDKGHFKVF